MSEQERMAELVWRLQELAWETGAEAVDAPGGGSAHARLVAVRTELLDLIARA